MFTDITNFTYIIPINTWSIPRRPLFSHSLVCRENHLFIAGIGHIFNKSSNFIFRSDRSNRTWVFLDDSTIRYICDAQNLNIICIISYFDIFPFFKHYFPYNIYAIILISLHRNAGPSHCLLFGILNKFAVLTTNKMQIFTGVVWL